MRTCICLIFLLITCRSFGQELFPHNEAASSIPKNVIGVRVFTESYNEAGTQRNMAALRLMYGLTAKLSLSASATVSNHHSHFLPTNLVTHTHQGNQTTYQTGTFQRGLKYDYQFNGIYAFAKYRFFTNDKQNEHFRMAAYGEASYISSAHDEAEPTLLDDTKGIGFGWIGTYLKRHFAVSLTTGIILPGSYSETAPDFFGGTQFTELQYGRTLKYNLSFGYLIFPFKYKSYSETNVNVYLELMGKSYESAEVKQNGIDVLPQTELLLKGNYLEAHPGLQFIFNSNSRLDFAVGFPVINKSFARFYPVFMVGVQHYFF